MKAMSCTVTSIHAVTSRVHKVLLDCEEAFDYQAGQYLQVIMGESDKRPFSIASIPSDGKTIELHIGADPQNGYAYEVLSRCKSEGKIEIEAPLGNAYLRPSDKKAVIIAGGTGYSYAKSIAMQCLAEQANRPLVMYWGGREITDLYEMKELEALAQANPHFSFVPVIENPPAIWQGKTGWVHQAAIQDIGHFEDCEVYTAGRFEMAATIKQDLIPLGLSADALFGDAYAFI